MLICASTGSAAASAMKSARERIERVIWIMVLSVCSDRLLDHRFELVFVTQAGCDGDDFAGAVYVEGHRQHFGVAEVVLFGLGIGEEDGIRDAELLRVFRDRVLAHLGVVRNADDMEAVVGVLLV